MATPRRPRARRAHALGEDVLRHVRRAGGVHASDLHGGAAQLRRAVVRDRDVHRARQGDVRRPVLHAPVGSEGAEPPDHGDRRSSSCCLLITLTLTDAATRFPLAMPPGSHRALHIGHTPWGEPTIALASALRRIVAGTAAALYVEQMIDVENQRTIFSSATKTSSTTRSSSTPRCTFVDDEIDSDTLAFRDAVRDIWAVRRASSRCSVP